MATLDEDGNRRAHIVKRLNTEQEAGKDSEAVDRNSASTIRSVQNDNTMAWMDSEEVNRIFTLTYSVDRRNLKPVSDMVAKFKRLERPQRRIEKATPAAPEKTGLVEARVELFKDISKGKPSREFDPRDDHKLDGQDR